MPTLNRCIFAQLIRTIWVSGRQRLTILPVWSAGCAVFLLINVIVQCPQTSLIISAADTIVTNGEQTINHRSTSVNVTALRFRYLSWRIIVRISPKASIFVCVCVWSILSCFLIINSSDRLPEASDLYRCSDSGNCTFQYALERERGLWLL